MITLQITDKDIITAKRLIAEFDKQKTYDKFKCNINYKGLLGEMILHKYLSNNNIPHRWIDFNKAGWNDPDFIIDGLKIDLKTTSTDDLWFNKIQHDVYILAGISDDDKTLTIVGWITNELLSDTKTNGLANKVNKPNRTVYALSIDHILPIELLSYFTIC